MVKGKKSRRGTVKRKEVNFIDGWGLILLIIGIALFILRQEVRFIGGVVALLGFVRILYVLFKYGQ